MATKIVITADTSQAKSEVAGLAMGLDGVGDQASAAAAKTEAAGERIEDALEEVQSEARKTGDAVSSVGGSNLLQGITAASTAFLAMGKALKGVGQLSREAYQGIQYLAEQGNPAARELMSSFDELLASMQRLASDPSVQDLGSKLSGVFSGAAKELELFPEAMRANLMFAESYWIQFQQSIGLAEDDAMVKFGFRIAAQRVELEQQKKRIANETEANKKAEEAKKLAEETAKLEKEAAEEQSQADLDAFNDSLRMEEEEFQKKNAHIAELVRNQEAANAKLLQSERDLQAQREKDAEDRIAKQKAALAGTGAAEGVNAAASDPQAIARRLAQQAADARRNELMAGGEQDGAKLDREAEQARRQAHRAAIQQSRGGREAFSQEQIQGAIEANASAGIQAMSEAGAFSQESLTALSQAAEEQRRMATEMQAMQDQLAEIRKYQAGTTQDGNRRRSQRNSNRQ